ncbi:structural maintenance of chromosomes protein 4-like [Chelonus insularis]|uniref:structural maintenance of chromosomes protein 4-like n=1 Tax=Chelonus insularis TaxID=460826 RepID=UPI00158DF14A|nr:structural maintenance of chromosomes protein 4-like [Chelonus insularis]
MPDNNGDITQNTSDNNVEVNTSRIICDYPSTTDHEKGCIIDGDIHIPPPPIKYNYNNKQFNNQRLVIKQIVCNNFKSYAGEVIIGPFNERFSSIVGPNGSGKSNVIDSMLFVFGFRANKIRTKHISELIHHSSEYPNVNSCTVAVCFHKIIDNKNECKNNIETVLGSEFVISRTAFKNNTSFYQLNGKKVQYKDIINLFKHNEIDLDYNRFLILQGEIEQIALMKPKAQNEHDSGMLEFLDDIIGTSRYKIPLEQLSQRVELLSENLNDKINRLHVIEHEREQLKESMEKAVDYLKIENDIAISKHKLYCYKKATLIIKLKDKERSEKEIADDLKKLKEKIESISKEKKMKNDDLNKKSEAWKVVQMKSDSIRAQFDKIRNKDEVLFAELKEINKRRKENIEVVNNESFKLQQLNMVPEKNVNMIKECEILIEKKTINLHKEENILEHLMSNLKEKTKPLLKKRAEFENQLIIHHKGVDQAKATLELVQSEYQFYTSTQNEEKKKLEELHRIINVTDGNLKNRKSQITSLETKIPVSKKNLILAQDKLEEIKTKVMKVSVKIKKIKIQIEEKKYTLTRNTSSNRVLNTLMREKKEKNISGIFGRLGDLGAIDLKYDIAVSTACGPLDNIVVDTANTAQSCIEFLRINNVGRATFIALDKMNRLLPYCKQKISTPENVPRLFDLIRVEDERVLPAFYYGLRDTLVANDLDQATRIAYGSRRYRVVTLKGELIEMSGTMSGGGSTSFRGRMGQSVADNNSSLENIANMEETLETLNKEYQDLKFKQRSSESEVEKLNIELRDMNVEKDKFNIEIKTLSDQLALSKSQIKVQEKKTANSVLNPVKIKEYTNAIEAAKTKYDKVKNESQSIEEEVVKMNKEIDKILGGSLKFQRKKITELKNSIDKAKSEICKLQVAIKISKRDVIKTEKKIETLQNEIQECENKLHDIQEQKKQCEIDAKHLLTILDECTELLKERDKITKLLVDELKVLQEKEDKIKALRIDIEHRHQDIIQVLKNLQSTLESYRTNINRIKLNKIPGQCEIILKDLDENEITTLDEEVLVENLTLAKKKLPESIPNMQVIDEFFAKDAIYMQKSEEVLEATTKRNKLRKSYDMIKKRRYDEFYAGFMEITSKLKEMYQMITLGGAAELELVDSMDPFTEGIVFSVRPPKKSWKNISNLSGGEKTLSSLALVFALHYYKPTPLYFMDEIDAALDYKNVAIVGTYIKERTKNAQFIVISLRSEMFELSDTLIGIYKTYNATKCVPFNIIDFFKRHPSLESRENQRLATLEEKCKKRRSQLITKKSGISKSMSLSNTDFESSHDNNGKSLNNEGICRKKNRQIDYNSRVYSTSPPTKKQRRLAYRRKISSSSDNLSSTSSISSTLNRDEAIAMKATSKILMKKRRIDSIRK